MSALIKLRAIQPNLSISETKIAAFLLDNRENVRQFSSQELARHVGVSQSSIVKFSQKLGYKGYPALKLAIVDDLNRENEQSRLTGQISLDDSIVAVAEKLLNSKINVLSETIHLNEAPTLDSAIDILVKARRTLIVGVGGSALVAKDFSYKMQKLGLNAIAETDGHAQMALASTLTNQDVVVAISESGATTEIVKLVEEVSGNKVKVISITKYGETSVSGYADIKLYSVAERAGERLSSILARTAQEMVIDTLFIGLTQASSEGRAILANTNARVKRFRQG
ncbi:MurR/RpiR family transcriptional regulator [Alteromonas sp. ASW11-130]|uniref:MurR/RpiR family transcriptional regulator n=1 Tax=Alteromonas sp. ASW11-130 TaxID=3015775 RepID=UPI002241B466|nr:MurR/RpiR family transcriptional regulator [Alteromonas sp. ASW11-130]MCW8092953.1 MurR/RpiR family transcriptional regulator [Alteromonas sp. ASW11-130]